MQIPKVPLDLVEEPPGLVALRGQQAAPVLETPRGAAGDGPQDLEVGDQSLRRRGLGADGRRRGVVGEAEHERRVRQHERARGLRPREVALIEPADLPGGEPMRRDRGGEAHAVARVGARQRHEVLHRGVRDDAAVLDVLLNGVGQRAHQTEASRHPAHAAIEAAGQQVQRDAMLVMERAEQPPLLERTIGGIRAQELPKDQGLRLRHLPRDGGDQVPVQLAETADAFVPIDHDVAGRRGHDHDGHLLARIR